METLTASILQEMLKHIEEFVEVPHPAFGNLPLCPFSRKFRLADQIRWLIQTITIESLYETKFDTNHLMTFVVDPRKNLCFKELESLKMQAELLFPEYYLFIGHPESDFCVNGVYTRREPYPNIQFIKKLDGDYFEAKLIKTRYFSGLKPQDIKVLEVQKDVANALLAQS